MVEATLQTKTQPSKAVAGCENPIQELLKDTYERELAGGDYQALKLDLQNQSHEEMLLLLEGCHEPGKHSERVDEGVRLILEARANRDFKLIADSYTFQNGTAREYLRGQFVRQAGQRKIDNDKYIKAQNWLEYYEAMKNQLVLDLDAACNDKKKQAIPSEKIRSLKLLKYRDFSDGNIEENIVKEGILAAGDIVPQIEALSQLISEIRKLNPNSNKSKRLTAILTQLLHVHDAAELEKLKKELEGMKSGLEARVSESQQNESEKQHIFTLVGYLEKISDLPENAKSQIAQFKEEITSTNPTQQTDRSQSTQERLNEIKGKLEGIKTDYITTSRTALMTEIDTLLAETSDETLKSNLNTLKEKIKSETEPLTFSQHKASLEQLTASTKKPKNNGYFDMAIQYIAGFGLFDGLTSLKSSDGKPSFFQQILLNLCNAGDISPETAGRFGITVDSESKKFKINPKLIDFLRISPKERFTAMGLSEENADFFLEKSLANFFNSGITQDGVDKKELKILRDFLTEQAEDMSDSDKQKMTLSSYLSPQKGRENLYAYWNFREEKLNHSSQPQIDAESGTSSG